MEQEPNPLAGLDEEMYWAFVAACTRLGVRVKPRWKVATDG